MERRTEERKLYEEVERAADLRSGGGTGGAKRLRLWESQMRPRCADCCGRWGGTMEVPCQCLCSLSTKHPAVVLSILSSAPIASTEQRMEVEKDNAEQ